MRFIKLITIFAAGFLLVSCASQGVNEVLDKKEKQAATSGKLFGESLSTGNLFDNSDDGVGAGGISVNSFLWRASLDTLSFAPLSQVDPFGGVIITDWYNPPETPRERFKLNVYILTRQLRSDGIRVSVFKQQQLADGQWQNVQVNKKTATQLENSILSRARQMRIAFEASQNN